MANPESIKSRNGGAANKSGTKNLCFPLDGSGGSQHMNISLQEYSRGNPRDPANISYAVAYIQLPLPMSGLNDNNSLSYEEVPLGGIGGLLAPVGNKGNKVAAVVVETARFAATAAISAGGDAAAGALKEYAGMNKTADAIIAGAGAINAAGGQAAGVSSNPNLSLSFQGVALREHNFSWRLIAKTAEESQEIFSIIETLKLCALPRQVYGASLTFSYPCVAILTFRPENLIKMSTMGCFIDSITVSYDGDGVPAFFRGDNRPVIVDLTIKFRERAVLTASDYDDEGDAVGKETIDAAIRLVNGASTK